VVLGCNLYGGFVILYPFVCAIVLWLIVGLCGVLCVFIYLWCFIWLISIYILSTCDALFMLLCVHIYLQCVCWTVIRC